MFHAMKRKFKHPAPGKLVHVKGHELHVYSEGQGKNTFVFMSGGGTRFPTLDFKPLWSILSTRSKIAVVEKAGYGWSDITKQSRDLDTILSETRETLKLAEIIAPYILVPHSMSGLEAIYWAQIYPDEVKAIIGLDPAIPEAYDNFRLPPLPLLSAVAFLSRYNILNPDIVNEVKHVKKNAQKVKQHALPSNTPIYFFISNGKGVGVKNWEGLLVNYLSNFKAQKHMSLDCGHYIHRYEAEKIASEVISFVEGIV